MAVQRVVQMAAKKVHWWVVLRVARKALKLVDP
jgi:hypothetical protein